MWIAIGLIIALFSLFTLLIILHPKRSMAVIEHVKIKRWYENHQEALSAKHRHDLESTLKRLADALNARMDQHHMFESSCCKRVVNDAYNDLKEAFERAYKAVNKNATSQDAMDALEHYQDPVFALNQTVYVPTRDMTGIITSINDDLTYTVCDVTDQCYRVYEWDLKSEEDEDPAS